ncbi:MarR family transcriptional regulator [Mesorhizobium sp. B4-1-3]|uniref:MarR family transcriptional regulator n=1 Tax=Mesorhizobium sp. B4-1-3 TaxID=2589889 RepID=UPI001127F25F|nr:MarR family transcriptional regulator [Mesorhizobium sp. B4-1-3]TPI13773.1 MarR family transcriptional regulator [Mesorhizobium sp. B4-1-3]
MANSDVYLRAMMSLVARQTFSPERLSEIVSPMANANTYETFNLCDGTRTQNEIANLLKMDRGNLSRSVNKWIDEGVMIKVTDDGKDRPVHVYPIPDRFIQSAKKKEGAKKKDG